MFVGFFLVFLFTHIRNSTVQKQIWRSRDGFEETAARKLVIKLQLMLQIAIPYCIIHKTRTIRKIIFLLTCLLITGTQLADKTSRKERERLYISFTSKCEEPNCLNSLLASTKSLLVTSGLNTNVKISTRYSYWTIRTPLGRMATLWLHDVYTAKVERYQQLQQIFFQKNGVGLKKAAIRLTLNFLKLSGKLF